MTFKNAHLRKIATLHDIPSRVKNGVFYIACETGSCQMWERVDTLDELQSYLYDNY